MPTSKTVRFAPLMNHSESLMRMQIMVEANKIRESQQAVTEEKVVRRKPFKKPSCGCWTALDVSAFASEKITDKDLLRGVTELITRYNIDGGSLVRLSRQNINQLSISTVVCAQIKQLQDDFLGKF